MFSVVIFSDLMYLRTAKRLERPNAPTTQLIIVVFNIKNSPYYHTVFYVQGHQWVAVQRWTTFTWPWKSWQGRWSRWSTCTVVLSTPSSASSRRRYNAVGWWLVFCRLRVWIIVSATVMNATACFAAKNTSFSCIYQVAPTPYICLSNTWLFGPL